MSMDGAVDEARPHGTSAQEVDPASDAWLMGRVIEGSEDALASLYDRHSEAVFAAAQRTSHESWIAAEVVQETFLALWNRAELFDPTRGTLRSWLLTIARNRAVDHLRSAGRHDRAATFSSFGRDGVDDRSMAEWLTASGELIGASGPDAVPEVAVTDKETRESIDLAIAALAPAERSVIVLAYDGGLSQSEIATRLGWPLGTVKTRTRRALRILREILEHPDGFGSSVDATPQRAAVEPAGSSSGPEARAPQGQPRVWPAVSAPASASTPCPCP